MENERRGALIETSVVKSFQQSLYPYTLTPTETDTNMMVQKYNLNIVDIFIPCKFVNYD